MRSRWLALTGFVLVATAGCTAHPGAAAVVNGETITQGYLQDTVDDFADLGEVTPSQLLNVLVAMRAGEDVVEDRGIAVSGADALAMLEDGGIDTNGFSPGGVEVARYIAIVTQTQTRADAEEISEEMDAARRAADIVINPRYGVLDTESGTIVDRTPAWIVTDGSAESEPTGR